LYNEKIRAAIDTIGSRNRSLRLAMHLLDETTRARVEHRVSKTAERVSQTRPRRKSPRR
jgi:hypothetical protein